jgi:TPR repeat protein
LAQLYQSGNGVGANAVEAAWWCAKAAEQGQAEAQFQLGIMYLEGIGVTQNSSNALHWISQAANKASSGSQGSITVHSFC